MDKVVVNDVFKAPKSGSPTFYLLPGIDGGDNLDPGANFAPGTKSWFGFTDLQGFFADENVNVVTPLGGQFSWYTQELPPLINAQYKTTLTGGGANADDMWGPQGGPLWVPHDPTVNVAKLKGVAVYAGRRTGDVDKLPPVPTISPATSVPITCVVRPEGSL
jgi:S-formylglutathione hydrolase FrmB